MSPRALRQPKLIATGSELLSPVFKPRPGWGGKLNQWWNRTGGIYILRAVILVALGLTAMGLLRRWDEQQTSASPKATQSAAPAIATQYSLIADHGAGITDLSAQVLDSYLAQQQVGLDAVEHLFAVDSLARSAGWKPLNRGQKVQFSSQTLAQAVISAKALTVAQRHSWLRILRR